MTDEIDQRAVLNYRLTRLRVNEWLLSKNGKTPELYAKALIKFEQLSKQNIEELQKKAENNEIKGREIRTLIITTTTGLSNPNQVRIDSAIRSFFGYEGTELPDTTIHYKKTQHFDEYDKTEVQALVGYLDKPREKLYAIIAAESGLRASTILKLKWKHVAKDFNNRTNSIALRLDDQFHEGSKKSGFTFIGHQARKLLKQLTESKDITTEPEALLFPYSLSSIEKIIQTAKDKVPIGSNVKRIHGFRKFYLNSLIKAKTSERMIDMLFGRFREQDAKEYTSQKIEELREYYEQAYPHLDYMNNIPEKAQELSSKQNQQDETIRQLNDKINALTEIVKSVLRLDFSNAKATELTEIAPIISQTYAKVKRIEFQE